MVSTLDDPFQSKINIWMSFVWRKWTYLKSGYKTDWWYGETQELLFELCTFTHKGQGLNRTATGIVQLLFTLENDEKFDQSIVWARMRVVYLEEKKNFQNPVHISIENNRKAFVHRDISFSWWS